jgi:hypothetical protein
LDRIQAPFYFLLSDSDHKDEGNRSPIDEVEYSGQGNRIATTPQTQQERLTSIRLALY